MIYTISNLHSNLKEPEEIIKSTGRIEMKVNVFGDPEFYINDELVGIVKGQNLILRAEI